LKLRRRFELESWISEWLISGDLGLRKPSPAIYLKAVERLGVAPGEITFVDDRPRNLDSAQDLGINAVLRDVGGDQPRSSHRRIRRLIDLL
jgi:HAD superfamily hydrolase (TIGR01509 family)